MVDLLQLQFPDHLIPSMIAKVCVKRPALHVKNIDLPQLSVINIGLKQVHIHR